MYKNNQKDAATMIWMALYPLCGLGVIFGVALIVGAVGVAGIFAIDVALGVLAIVASVITMWRFLRAI